MLPLLWISRLRGPECNQHQGGNKPHRPLEVPYWEIDARKGENVEAYVLPGHLPRKANKKAKEPGYRALRHRPLVYATLSDSVRLNY
jgi:hypothetical protein